MPIAILRKLDFHVLEADLPAGCKSYHQKEKKEIQVTICRKWSKKTV